MSDSADISPEHLRQLRQQSFLRWFFLMLIFGLVVGTVVRGSLFLEDDPSSRFMPHGHCIRWTPGLLWMQVTGDAAIALAYFLIPLAMLAMLRALPEFFFSPSLIYLFAFFIVTCGLTHVTKILTTWVPLYYLQASVTALCAGASIATVVQLFRVRAQLTTYIQKRRMDAEIQGASR